MEPKRALVLGASQGLGAHIAVRLAEDGWSVTGVGRRPRQVTALDGSVEYLQADLSQAETLVELPKLVAGCPDLIVHSAVTYHDFGVSVPTLDELEQVFRVNALLPYRLLHQLLSDKPGDRFCSCVVLNSDAIFHARRLSGIYAASKAALRVLTTMLADTFRADNASVSTLLLGPLADAKKTADLQRIATKRGMSPEELTKAFLRRSNPDLVIDELIDFESCYLSLRHLVELGAVANGSLYRLDGGSAGSLI
ncbi:SDR family oxidoreductase [Kitasatospora sp. NPDC056731]|uniref:SDR family NAD(P)-dependent oxidoreductase n=1 Tax=Kitasatospora sp. NPDC056731 TaxID=3155422 RepID=UPI00342B22E4